MKRLIALITLAAAACASGTPINEQSSSAPAETSAAAASASATAQVPASPTPVLTDGRHPAYAKSASSSQATVDVVQFLTGQAAKDAYVKAHPDDPEGPPNDYYIVNENTKLRTIALSGSVQVLLVKEGADVAPATVGDFVARVQESQGLFWFTVSGGVVTKVEEQYLP